MFVSSLLKDPDNFIAYCKETKRLYVEECGFYPLSPTGHKILDHPKHYLTVFPSTIATGMTSEEPAEGANKFVKRFQVENAFQGDLQRRNLDVFHRLMDRSCPSVLAFLVDKKLEWRKKEELPKDVLPLLKVPTAPVNKK